MSYSWDKIGRRIREERKKMPSKLPKTGKRKSSSVTQAELAEMICKEMGMADTGTYRKKVLEWEAGKPADLEELLALCNIFHCDLHYLLCETDTRFYTDSADTEKFGLSAGALDQLIAWKREGSSQLLSLLSSLICNERLLAQMALIQGMDQLGIFEEMAADQRQALEADPERVLPGQLSVSDFGLTDPYGENIPTLRFRFCPTADQIRQGTEYRLFTELVEFLESKSS